MSSEKDDQKREWDKAGFHSDLGTKANVERWEGKGEGSANANLALQQIGHGIKQNNPELAQAEYLGSTAIHFYMTPMLRQPYFVCQPGTLGKVSEVLVPAGLTELRNELMQMFGHKPQRKRSGF